VEERRLLTDDLHYLRVLARQMYRLGWMAIRHFDEGGSGSLRARSTPDSRG
jgi:hypothetical protein